MNKKQLILNEIRNNPQIGYKEIADKLKINTHNIACQVNKLKKEGLIPQDYNQKHVALQKQCEEIGIPIENVSNYWYKGKHYSIHVKGQQVGLEDVLDNILGQMKKHSPKYPKIIRPKKPSQEHLMVISPADIHIGKLCSAYETGDEYNENIARQRVLDGVSSLLAKSQMFGIKESLLVIGNDILHTDNAKSTTTSGTFQDSNMMWYDAFNFAFKLYLEVIEMITAQTKLKVVYNPSNHDYTSGFMLAKAVSAWFSKTDMEFDISPAHRKYTKFGKNLIGTTHGDGAKEQDLPMLMAHETPFWNECSHRYIYTHHIHHKKAKDYMSVVTESFRSPSGTDSWHHRNGYQHSPKAIEAFIHHPEYGQVSRLTQFF